MRINIPAPKTALSPEEPIILGPESAEYGRPDGWGKMEATLVTTDMVKIDDYREDMDALLTFAGLFSAVLSAFVLVSYQDLKQDTAEAALHALETISMQLASYIINQGSVNSTIPAYTPVSFEPSSEAILVNVLWFSSLVLSVATASFSILVKQWLHEYLAGQFQYPQQRLRARQFRRPGLRNWKVFEIASALPFLLQISLGLFFIGLCVFTASAHPSVGHATLVLVAGWATFFSFTIIAPLFSARCPYKTTFLRRPLSFAREQAILGLSWLFSACHLDISFKPLRELDALNNDQRDHKIFLQADRNLFDDNLLLMGMRECSQTLTQLSPEKTVNLVFEVLHHRLPRFTALSSEASLESLRNDLGTLQSSLLRWIADTLSNTWQRTVTSTLDRRVSWEGDWVKKIVKVLAAMPQEAFSHSSFARKTLQERIIQSDMELPESLICTIFASGPIVREDFSQKLALSDEKFSELLQWLSHNRDKLSPTGYRVCIENLLAWKSIEAAVPLGWAQALASVKDVNILVAADAVLSDDYFLATIIWDAFERLDLGSESLVEFVLSIVRHRFILDPDPKKFSRKELMALRRISKELRDKIGKTLSMCWRYVRDRLNGMNRDSGKSFDTLAHQAVSILAAMDLIENEALLTLQSFVTQFPAEFSTTVICQILSISPLTSAILSVGQTLLGLPPDAHKLSQELRRDLLHYLNCNYALFTEAEMLFCLQNITAWSAMSAQMTSTRSLLIHLDGSSWQHLVAPLAYILYQHECHKTIKSMDGNGILDNPPKDDIITTIVYALAQFDSNESPSEPLWYLDIFKSIFANTENAHTLWKRVIEPDEQRLVLGSDPPMAFVRRVGNRLGLAIRGGFKLWQMVHSSSDIFVDQRIPSPPFEISSPIRQFLYGSARPEDIAHNTITFIRDLKSQDLLPAETRLIHDFIAGAAESLMASEESQLIALATHLTSLLNDEARPVLQLQPVSTSLGQIPFAMTSPAAFTAHDNIVLDDIIQRK